MKSKLTPLQELYWRREELIGKLWDSRIKGEARDKIIAEAREITYAMNRMEEPIYAAM